MTFFTDLLVALVAVLCARRLWKENSTSQLGARSSARWYWAVALIALAVAAFAGGVAHAFAVQSPSWLDSGLWRTVFFAMGLASYSMMVGTAYASARNPLRTVVMLLAGAHFLVYATWMARHSDFKFVVAGYGFALVVVGLLAATTLVRGHQQASMRWWLTAIGITALASIIQRSGFTLHRNFNHNDLYHVIGMFGVLAFYLGARKVTDADQRQPVESAAPSDSSGATDSSNPPVLDVDSHSSA